MPWLEWCPDPQRPDARWVKIFHPGTWTLQEEHDDPPPPRHTYREWKFILKTAFNPLFKHGTGETRPLKDTGVSQLRNQTVTVLRLSPDQHSVATQSSTLRTSPQVLEAILRPADASTFSTEDLTCLQAGISQQLADRTRQALRPHQPVRTSRDADPLQAESAGVADPYLRKPPQQFQGQGEVHF